MARPPDRAIIRQTPTTKRGGDVWGEKDPVLPAGLAPAPQQIGPPGRSFFAPEHPLFGKHLQIADKRV